MIERLSPVWGRPWTVIAEHAEGCHVTDRDGREYLDFTSGIGVTNTGHCHPRVVEAVCRQAKRIAHAQANILVHGPMLELAEALGSVLPRELDCCFFANSGAEAVEAAIKLARQVTGRPNLIAFEGGFHGRTIATMSLTSSKSVYRAGYQPLMPGVFLAPFGRKPGAASESGSNGASTVREALQRVRMLLKTQTAPRETSAMVVEPVLGEGGFIPADPAFLVGLRRICDEHGILLVVDEVQTGFGRTGRFFAFEESGILPDIVVMAKGLASGYPLSGIAASKKLMRRWPVGSHGGTYGGNAVACAAAVATIQVLKEERLVERAATLGRRLTEGLSSLASSEPGILEVRGPGLMVGVEFRRDRVQGAQPLARQVQRACYERGLLLLTCGVDDQVVRWLPPLVVEEEQVDEALVTFRDAVQEVARASSEVPEGFSPRA